MIIFNQFWIGYSYRRSASDRYIQSCKLNLDEQQ